MAKPLLPFDKDLFERLCAIHCTAVEICSIMGFSQDTLDRRVKSVYKRKFAEVFEQKKGSGKASLRREMFRVAQSGNPTMLIWLSKNWLGMRDQVEVYEREQQYDDPTLDEQKPNT